MFWTLDHSYGYTVFPTRLYFWTQVWGLQLTLLEYRWIQGFLVT